MAKHLCGECGERQQYGRVVIQHADRARTWVCVACWQRWDYSTFLAGARGP
jgi:hypothetical protein